MGKRSRKEAFIAAKRPKNGNDPLSESNVFAEIANDSRGDDALSVGSRRHHNIYKEDANKIEDYELTPRSFKGVSSDATEGLPVKTADGGLKRIVLKDGDSENEDNEVESEKSDEDNDIAPFHGNENVSDYDEANDEDYKELSPETRERKIKEDIAQMAESLMENPEDNVLLFAKLLRMMSSHVPSTAKLSLLSVVPVFKSICPSYKVRPLTDAEKHEKVSNDVQKVRFFEQNLVRYYRKYLDVLSLHSLKFSTSPKATDLDIVLGILSTRAACQLASPLRFFNFRSDLMRILIRRIMHKPASAAEYDVFKECVKTLEALLVEDVDLGSISLDISRMLSRSIRRRNMKVDESVVNIFLSLTVLRDYDPHASAEEKEKKIKLKRKEKVFLTKKQRKELKEKKKIEKEIKDAEFKITAEERERFQAEILRTLLTLYLEILRSRPEKLMAPVLEGISKYGRQVNLDMIGDFLQVLREISHDLLDSSNENIMFLNASQTRQVLLCVITSFSLLSYLPSKRVHLDLNNFVEYLYRLLPLLSEDAEIEFSYKTLRLMDPLATDLKMKPSVNISTEAELLLKGLNAIFFKSRSGSQARSLAFTKRLYTAMLQFPDKSTIAVMKFIGKLISRYDDIVSLYTTEDRIQNGVYRPYAETIEGANTEVAVLWENLLLEKHYNPTIAMGARALINRAKKEPGFM